MTSFYAARRRPPAATPHAMNAYTLFSRALQSGKVWLHDGERGFSGGEVANQAARHAAWLVSLGLAAGDRVMMQLEDSAQALFLYLGTLRAGCIAVPLPTAWPAADMTRFVHDAEPRLIVCEARAQAAIADLARGMTAPAKVTGIDALQGLAAPQPAAPEEAVPRSDDDAALILYSAGTTGTPRGGRLTHGMLAANAGALAQLWRLTPDDTVLAALPLFSVHGLCAALHPAMAGGAALRMRARGKPASAADLAGISVLVAEPQTYQDLLDESAWPREALAKLRLCISAAAHLAPDTARAFGERSGHLPRQCYGSSEAGIITAHAPRGEFRIDSAGRPLPGTRLRIVGSNLKPMPLEHQGEIQLPAFSGWWRRDSAEALTADGWFRTGDIGMWDEDGYIVVVGRAADVIASGYYRIYPEDVEHALEALPGVAAAAVIGRPHPELGSAAHAYIVRSSGIGEAEVRTALQSRLAHYQIPEKLIFVEALPRNALGRVQKMKLRAADTA